MIYITGDTHGELARFSDERIPAAAGDKVIIAGDFGFVLHNNQDEKNKLDALAKKPYEILFLDGNHENFPVLETYPDAEQWGAPVKRIRDNIYWLRRGYVYTIEGSTFFTFGGGYSIDKEWRERYQFICGKKIWFEEELPSPEEYRRAIRNLQACNGKVDYILTHTAPRTIIPRVIGKTPDPHENELNGFLDWIYHEMQFKKWYFGHLHADMQVNDQMIACCEQLHKVGNE